MSKALLTLTAAIALTEDDIQQIAAAVAEINGSKKNAKDIPEKYMEDSNYTKDQISNILKRVMDEVGKAQAKELLGAFDAKNIGGISEDDYKDFYESALEILGEDDLDEDAEEDEDDDMFGDEADEDEDEDEDEDDDIDVDEIKVRIQKLASKNKDKAQKVLSAGDLNTVRGLKSASPAQLKKIIAALKKA